MKIALLTSSRADYSIYLPLIKAIEADSFFSLSIIAFGTHLSRTHGFTANQIVSDGYKISHKVESMMQNDNSTAVSTSMGLTMINFAPIWEAGKFDVVLALGDRYEMFAAVSSTIPFNIPIAHIHGGETTLGAIDNIFRHSISIMSKYHFTVTESYKNKLIRLLDTDEHIYNVGTLSYENFESLRFLSKAEFYNEFSIDLNKPTILITFHPETVSVEKNKYYICEILSALSLVEKYQLVITMPNADTMGNLIREEILAFAKNKTKTFIVESLGTIGYMTCMKYCSFLLGNTSSGFAEAAYFPKMVINLGDRQKGRLFTPNIINTPINAEAIKYSIENIENYPLPEKILEYGNGNASKRIVEVLKSIEQ